MKQALRRFFDTLSELSGRAFTEEEKAALLTSIVEAAMPLVSSLLPAAVERVVLSRFERRLAEKDAQILALKLQVNRHIKGTMLTSDFQLYVVHDA